MHIAKDTVASIHYTLTVDGETVDSSEGSDPLTYLHGHQQIIPGLEAELEGKTNGDTFDVTIAPAQGYGDIDEDLVLTLPKEMFSEDQQSQLQPGIMFQGPHPENQEVAVRYTVVDITEDSLTANGNHPLAGKTLHFAGSVTEVRAASESELGGDDNSCCPGGSC